MATLVELAFKSNVLNPKLVTVMLLSRRWLQPTFARQIGLNLRTTADGATLRGFTSTCRSQRLWRSPIGRLGSSLSCTDVSRAVKKAAFGSHYKEMATGFWRTWWTSVAAATCRECGWKGAKQVGSKWAITGELHIKHFQLWLANLCLLESLLTQPKRPSQLGTLLLLVGGLVWPTTPTSTFVDDLYKLFEEADHTICNSQR